MKEDKKKSRNYERRLLKFIESPAKLESMLDGNNQLISSFVTRLETAKEKTS